MGARASILLVDDDAHVRALVRRLLCGRGHEVIEADSLAEGRATLEQSWPHLVLLDLDLKDGSGERLLDEIRAQATGPHVPVIALAAINASERDGLVTKGFDDVIVKPFGLHDFCFKVESLLVRYQGFGAGTVLVVDQDEALSKRVASVLARSGFAALTAATAAEASDHVDKGGIDLIVVDQALPDMKGSEWLAGLRSSGNATKAILIGLMEGDPTSLEKSGRELGVSLLLQKPVTPAVLAEFIVKEIAQAAPDRRNAMRESFRAQVTARESFQGRLLRVAGALHAACAHKDVSNLEIMQREVHNLAGTAGSYGYMGVTDALAQVDKCLSCLAEKDMGFSTRLRELEHSVRHAELALEALHDAQVHSVAEKRPFQVMVIGADEGLRELVARLGNDRLWDVIAAASASEALLLSRQASPDVVIVDHLLGCGEDGFHLARELRAIPQCTSVPLIFISGESTLDHRIAAAHLGASAFVHKPVDPEVMIAAVESVLAIKWDERPRVLVVDDDWSFCQLVTSVLSDLGLKVHSLQDPSQIVDVLDETCPDLVLLDVAMANVSGFDICRVVRTSERWRHLPVLFLTRLTGVEIRTSAFQAGADDYLPKPVVREELAAKVTAILTRTRLLRERADKDFLTGLYLRRAFLDRLTVKFSHAKKTGIPLALGLIDLDHFKQINDTHGHLAGDRVLATLGSLLARRFRAQDLRGRWGGEELVVAFPGEDARTVHAVLCRVQEEFREIRYQSDEGHAFHATFSAGVACFPDDGNTVPALLRVADGRLYQAKAGGRDRVVTE
ncbi:MAG: response regulator [Deltaproteobacteria bacterium]|nr:response regulator [Deltaproteobacteria bacterium]